MLCVGVRHDPIGGRVALLDSLANECDHLVTLKGTIQYGETPEIR